MFIINVVMLLFIPTLRVWIMCYIKHSFHSVLPWTTCGNSWNTKACVDLSSSGFVNETKVFGNSSTTISYQLGHNMSLSTVSAEEEFWRYELLKESPGIEVLGELNWELVLYNFILRGLVVLCVIKSVASIGKVMYFTTFIPLVLLVTVWIRSLTLPGSTEGLVYFLRPDFAKLADKQMWMEAGFAALNTLAIGMGGTLVIGSRGKFHSGIFRSTICACSLDIFGSIFTSMVLFSVLGVMAVEQSKPISSVVTTGTSVGFVGFTKAFSYLPKPKVWTIIFFVATFIALLDVMILIKEVVVYFVMQWIPFCQKRHKLVVIGVFILSFILSLPFVTQTGPYIFQIVDWYFGSWCTLIASLCEIIICMWIFGGDRIDNILRQMTGKPMPAVLRFLAAFVCPVICIVMYTRYLFYAITMTTIFLITSILMFRPPTYGDYHYPVTAEVFGYCLGIIPVLPLPLFIVIKVYRMEGPLSKRFRTLLKPTQQWGPVEKVVKPVRSPMTYGKRSFCNVAFYNFTGRYKNPAHKSDINGDEMSSVAL